MTTYFKVFAIIFPFFICCQTSSFQKHIDSLNNFIEVNRSSDEFYNKMKITLASKELSVINFDEFNGSFENDVTILGEINDFLIISKINESKTLLARHFIDKFGLGSLLLFYFKNGVYYSSINNLDFSISDSLISKKYEESNVKKYYPITIYNKKRKEFEHCIIYYDYSHKTYGSYYLYKPKKNADNLTFKIIHNVLKYDFNFEEAFTKRAFTKRFVLNICNNYTLPFKMQEFSKQINLLSIPPSK